MQLDHAQPLYSVRSSQGQQICLGQSAAQSEALFFCLIGYTVDQAKWNGHRFVTVQKFYPGDLEEVTDQ